MIERGHRAGFAFEARPAIGIANKLFREDFDGDRAIEPCVPRLVDLTHATCANQAQGLHTGRGERRTRAAWGGSGP